MKSRIFVLSARLVSLYGSLILCGLLLGPRANGQTQPPIITIDAPGAGILSGPGTTVTSINDSGWMAGYYSDVNNLCHGFVRSPDGTFASFDSPTTPPPAQATCPQPAAINSSGVVTGSYADPSFGCTTWSPFDRAPTGCGGNHGFLRQPDGAFITFDLLPFNTTLSNPQTFPRSVNSAGQITGTYATGDQGSAQSCFLRNSDGTVVTFDPPNANEQYNPSANSINGSGSIVGTFTDASTTVAHGFLRAADGSFTVFDAPGANTRPGYGGTSAVAINSQGEITGDFRDANGVNHSYVRAPDGTLTVFDGPNAGTTDSFPGTVGINDSGTVIGRYRQSLWIFGGFLRASDGTITTFLGPGGVSIYPSSINSSGAIVGDYTDAQSVSHGFLRPGPNAPAINSFSPTSGSAGTMVTLSGVHFTGTTAVTFNWTPAASFQTVSDTTLTADIPGGATTGPIFATNAMGMGASATNFTPTATGLPTISGFSPTGGQPGAMVTITGTNFTGTTGVSFANVPARFFRGVSETQLTVAVPGGEVTGPITVTNTSGSGISQSNFLGSPQNIFFSPTSGSVGTSVTVTGVNFTGTTQVAFNGTPATFQVASDTQLTTVVPSGATQGSISVTNAAGTGIGGSFFVNSNGVPTITSFTPSSGPVGTQVTINGTNFTGTQWVVFNDYLTFNGCRSFSFRGVSDTQLIAAVCNGAQTGPITVQGPSGAATSTTNFTVTSSGGAPTISSFSPTSGTAGTTVTVTGTSFTETTRVTFNGTAAAFNVVSDTQLTAVVPNGATSGPIMVTNAAGSGTSAGIFGVLVPPTISSFSPSSGPAGTTVTITGTSFTGATAVSFNGTAAAAWDIVSDTQVTAVVPCTAQSGPITITNKAGSTTSTSSFTVTPLPAPVVSSFSPTTGPLGSTVSLMGAHFLCASGVAFNGVAASFFPITSDSQMVATVPSGATTGPITVTNAAGTRSSSINFTVATNNALSVSSFSPTTGFAGIKVTISGSGFTGTTSVTFNGTAASSFTVVTDWQLTAVVPSGATTGPITVTTTLASTRSVQSFTVTSGNPPVVSSFSPTSGVVGTLVTLTGTNFTGTTGVSFNGGAAGQFNVISDTQLKVDVSSGATSGPITVTNQAGSGISTASFRVLPHILSFTPMSGTMGTRVTIAGTSFTGATQVTFFRLVASFTVDSDTQITATVPGGAMSGWISVTTPSGTAYSPSFRTFTVNSMAAPTISSFTPSSGLAGTTVTLTGTNFTGTTGVSFNGTPATTMWGTSDTQFNAKVPSGATSGQITLTNSMGSAVSATNFTMALHISSFTPASGTMGTTVTITGTGFTGATAVTFFRVPASFSVVSDTQITATVPGGALSGWISVKTANGTTWSSNHFTAASAGPPTISSFSPASGSAGWTVTLTGTNFTGTTGVSINGTAATTFWATSDTQLNVKVPSGATSGPITVKNTAGTASGASSFTVN